METVKSVPPKAAPPSGRASRLKKSGMVLVFLIGMSALIHIPPVRTTIIRFAVNLVNPFESAEITIDDSSGFLFSNIGLSGIRIIEKDTVPVSVDMLRLRFNVIDVLLNRRLASVEIGGVTVYLAQNRDGSWILPSLKSSSKSSAPAKREATVTIRLLDIGGVTGRFSYWNTKVDSTWTVDALSARIVNLKAGTRFSARLDTLNVRFSPASTSESVTLTARGSLEDNYVLELTADLNSKRSQFSVTGSFPVGTAYSSTNISEHRSGNDASSAPVRLTINAPELALLDISPFVSGLNTTSVVSLVLNIDGGWNNLSFSLESDLPNGASLRGSGHVERRQNSVRVDARLTVDQLRPKDLFAVSTSPVGTLNGVIDAELTGSSMDQLNGRIEFTAQHVTDIPSLFNTLTFRQTFSQGRGDFTLDMRADAGLARISGWIRPMDSVVTWEAAGTVDIENLGAFAPSVGIPAAISGRVRSARLSPDAKATMSFQIDNGFSGSCKIGPGAIETVYSTGKWSAVADITVCDDGVITARAESGREGGWTIRTQFGGLNVTSALGLPEHEGTASSSVTGSASAVIGHSADAEIRGDLTLVRSRYDRYSLDSLHVQMTYSDDMLDARFRVRLDSALMTGIAQIETTRGGRSLRIDGLNFERINIEQFIGTSIGDSPVRTDLSGRGSFQIRIDPDNLIVTAGTVSISPSSINDLSISSGDVLWSSGPEAIDLETIVLFDDPAETNQPRSFLQLSARLTNNMERLALSHLEGNFEHLDVGRLIGVETLTTDVSGSVRARGDTDHGNIRLKINPGSSINALMVEDVDVQVEWNEIDATVNARIASSNGVLTGDGTFSRDETSTTRIGVLASEFDLAALLGGLIPAARVPPSTNSYVPTGSALNAANSHSTSSISFVGWIEQAAHNTDYSSADPCQADSSNATSGFACSTWRASVDSLIVDWSGLSIRSGRIDAALTPDGIQLDTLHVSGGFGYISASGTIKSGITNSSSETPDQSRTEQTALHAVIRLSAARDLGPLSSFLPATWSNLDADVRFTGAGDKRRLQAHVESSNVHYSGARIAHVTSDVRAELGEGYSIAAAELESKIEIVSVGGTTIESIALDVEYLDDRIALSTLVRVDERRQILAELRADPFADPPVVEITEVIAELDKDTWRLQSPAQITLTPLPRISNLILSSGESQFAVTSIDLSGHGTILANLKDFNLESVSDVFGFDGLGGILSGQIIITRPDQIVHMEGSFSSSLVSYEVPAGELSIQVSVKSNEVMINAVMSHDSGRSLSLKGEFNLEEKGLFLADSNAGSVRVSVVAEDFPVDWTRPFLDRSLIDHIAGVVTTDLTIHGTWTDPFIAGSLVIVHGAVGLTELGKRGRGLIFDQIEADMTFREDSVLVRKFSAHSGAGVVEMSGSMALPALTLGQFAFDIEAKEFLAVNNSLYRAVIDGIMHISGTTEAPVLSGKLNLLNTTYFLTNESNTSSFQPVSLSEEDVLNVERSFGIVISETDTSTFDLYKAMEIRDLRVHLSRDSWLRSGIMPTMDIQFIGDLDISKESNEDPVVFGNIEVLPERSQIIQFGRKFRITRGDISLNGPIDNPTLDLEATYVVPSRTSSQSEVVIRLIVQGSIETLSLSFESEPQMELSDVISYIVIGRPVDESLKLAAGGSQSASATSLAVGSMSALAERIAGRGLGLDVVEVRFDAESGLMLTGGKYVNPQLYVAVSQPVTGGGSSDSGVSGAERFTAVTIEYEIIRNFLASLISRGPLLKYSVRWHHDF